MPGAYKEDTIPNALGFAVANAAPSLLDGYSTDEHFFIAWAQLWMSKVRPEAMLLLISSDPYPPSAVRATGQPWCALGQARPRRIGPRSARRM